MDRRAFVAALGTTGAALIAEAKATGIIREELGEEVEHVLLARMAEAEAAQAARRSGSEEERPELKPLPDRPTLVDILELRLRGGVANHLLQSANNALKRDMDEEIVLACLLHDLGIAIHRPDHGYWGAQMIKPYVSEKVDWAIKYHQALRFYPDPDVGYEYPELYIRLFGEDYKPEPYIEADYKYARNHRWYMNARKVTMMDEYSFDRNAEVSVDPFVDIIGRHFKQPKEGLGWDNTPVSHMWRTLMFPNRPL